VRNSSHFGAAGWYAALAPAEGLIGIALTTARSVSVVPTRAAVPVFGTHPIAFAAPAGRHPPVVLDISTATVAANKVKVYDFNQKPLPQGWVVDEAGAPVSDAALALDYIFRRDVGGLTPLGGEEVMSSHKGYGLALMVQALCGALAGAAFAPVRARTQKPGDPDNVGHFFLALRPEAFRPDGGFEAEMEQMVEVLHAARPADPERPVLVPGDPERAARAQRAREGVPVPPVLAEKIKAICARSGAAYLLEA
jgi:LDH2 family malate/lactate/ureidoglycolate dehydrogenase